MARSILLSIVVLLFLPSTAGAHDFTGDSGFLSGLAHPVLGLDHLLAMLSVGILSAQIGGRAIWTIPATFVVVMLAGGLLGLRGAPLPAPEAGIALSVLVLGIALAAGRALPPHFAMVFVGFFAIFHGYAHGTEMPALAAPGLYIPGFVLGTASIHAVGVLIGLGAERTRRGAALLRTGGAGVAAAGLYLLLLQA